jgi:large subunit ribosomal protein L17
MRHRKKGKKLSRDTAHRIALFRNLIANLILHEEIETTLAKAKVIKRLTDKLIAKAKKSDSLHNKRLIHSYLQNKKAVKKIFEKLTKRFEDRQSGFTRISRLGARRGDSAMMAKIELIKKPKTKNQKLKTKNKKFKTKKTEKIAQKKTDTTKAKGKERKHRKKK